MVGYNISKSEHDDYDIVFPRHIFVHRYKEFPDFIIETEYAYYKNSFYKDVEKLFDDKFERIVAKSFMNKNRNLVDNEIIYISKDKKAMIGIKQYWDINDYADGEVEDDVIDAFEDIEINSNTKIQAKLVLYLLGEDKKIIDGFSKIVSTDKKAKKKKRELNIIAHRRSEGGLYLKNFKTNPVEIDIEENYNEDFLSVSDLIVKTLNDQNKTGIVLLHSEPGCGKTSYLRYLTQKITDKRIIYLPPDIANRLADPDFISFLMNYPDSILIIEDAESCLQKRDVGGNQAVSNLLNSSDGLLGDALKLQVICTFNCEISQIDPALMRPGRLIAKYKFEKLSVDKTNKLMKKLYGEQASSDDSLTLAKIYNFEKRDFEEKKTTQIGFIKR